MKRNFSRFFLGASCALPLFASAQSTLSGQVGRTVTSAVPFLNFTPDARSGGLGEAGVALSPDANSIYWNPSKLVFAQKDAGLSTSYTPWLRNLIGDMYYANISGYKKLGKDQVIGLSLLYFDLGTIDFTTAQGVAAGSFNSKEYAFTASYSRRLARNFSLGVNLKYLNSNLAGGYAGTGAPITPGATAAADISAYYQNQVRDDVSGRGLSWSFGAMMSNIGGKINYGSQERYFIPTNLRLGTGVTYHADRVNKFTFLLDFNKLMVPTPPKTQVVNGVTTITAGKDPNRNYMSAIFGSFTDAPGGVSEELKEVTISTGVEYWYNDQFAARVGYFNESREKGNRKYFTTGIGFRLPQGLGVDFSYMLPTNQTGSPLANTFRVSLLFNVSKSDRINDDTASDNNE